MKLFAIISLLPFLTIFVACTSAPKVAIAPKVIVATPPPAAMVECPKPFPRARLKVTGDVFTANTHNERALATCAAQVDTIRAWAETVDADEAPR
jgi:hypothetical protein